MGTGELEGRLRESWDVNATAWTRAVRERRIPSRRAGTDAAVLALCGELLDAAAARGASAPRVLDVGCGEGWLSHALSGRGADVLGVDGSAALVAVAAADAPRSARFEALAYDTLVADGDAAAGPFDLVVCNFALLGDPLAPLLGALGARLAPGGRLVVQTVHPWTAMGDGPYRDEWREERFASFDEPFPSPMPWFARTMASWLAELRSAGLHLLALREPLHPETARPLSLLLLGGRV